MCGSHTEEDNGSLLRGVSGLSDFINPSDSCVDIVEVEKVRK